ncbi:hypothetical protein PQX77_016359 [Marasmius sp. AFHP31]|nr:hypothetical protein PQX77_016359 [Marasmius sp. AFHP31]
MPKTNDGNEGEFGNFRRSARTNPNMTLGQYNSRKMFKSNDGTPERMKSMSASERTKLRELTRKEDESGQAKKVRDAIMGEFESVAAEKREKEAARKAREKVAQDKVDEAGQHRIQDVQVLDNCYSVVPRQPGYLSVESIDLQLDWYSQHENDTPIPKKSQRGNRQEKYVELRRAIDRFNARVESEGARMIQEGVGRSDTRVTEHSEVVVGGEEAECGSVSDGYSVDSAAEYYE